jgi:hypothetical protein
MGRLETPFERKTIGIIRKMFPDCIILKNDANNVQGIPDRLVLYWDRWAALEFKASRTAITQPNQPYYVGMMNEMSYASFVYPENVDQVLNDLQHALEPRR